MTDRQQPPLGRIEPSTAAAASDPSRYTVPALARGLQLLGLFSRDQPELSGADLAHLTGWPRASVFRMLQTLEQASYLERCGEEPTYRLGVAVLGLGFQYLAGHEMAKQGQPILDALCQSSGHSAHLAIRDAREVVFIAKSTAASMHFHAIPLGSRAPAHCTALGSVLLKTLSLGGLTRLYQGHSLTRYSASTPATLAALQAQIERDAQCGYALCEGGFEPGVSAIAAPVLNQRRQVCAAINITMASSSIAPAVLPGLVQQVRQAAQTLTRHMAALPHIR